MTRCFSLPFRRAGDLAWAQLPGVCMWSSCAPARTNPGLCSCCLHCKNKSTGLMSAPKGLLMHHSGLINFMDPLPEHVVNESRNYKHQASSMPSCSDRQVTVKSQAWTCGCFCFTSKGT